VALLPQKHKRLTLKLLCGVFFMFGFCYMLVPIYKLVCQKEGLNGSGANVAALADANMRADKTRTIKVYFTTTLHGGLGFKFQGPKAFVEVHPGEGKLVYFYAENQTGKDLTVQAVPSITPSDGARFMKKTECFCFTQQYFFNKQKANMPVYFFIDPAVSKDIKEMTLSYTLFDASGFPKKDRHFIKGKIDL
jgi:cytochrome c oxidase assembly protein subunit 11